MNSRAVSQLGRHPARPHGSLELRPPTGLPLLRISPRPPLKLFCAERPFLCTPQPTPEKSWFHWVQVWPRGSNGTSLGLFLHQEGGSSSYFPPHRVGGGGHSECWWLKHLSPAEHTHSAPLPPVPQATSHAKLQATLHWGQEQAPSGAPPCLSQHETCGSCSSGSLAGDRMDRETSFLSDCLHPHPQHTSTSGGPQSP